MLSATAPLFFEAFQPCRDELGAQPGERARKTAGNEEEGVVEQELRGAEDEERGDHLTRVVEDCAKYGGDPEMPLVDPTFQQEHPEQAEKGARGAVDQRHVVAAEYGAQDQAHRHDHGDLMRLVMIYRVDGDDIREPELDPRDGEGVRDL